MNIINYLNFDEKIIKKYNKYFLLGKETTLINEIEEAIIQYLNKDNSLKIFREDLNLTINIYDLHKKLIQQDLFFCKKLLILRAQEGISLDSVPIKNILLIFKKLIPNSYLIVKAHVLKRSYSELLIYKKTFCSMNPLIINCKIDNNINEVKSWLLIRNRFFKLNFSPKIYTYLYECYENDVETLSQILNLLNLNATKSIINLSTFSKILDKHYISFTFQHIIKYLANGDLDIIFENLFLLKNLNKQEKIIDIFFEFKFFIIFCYKKVINKEKNIFIYFNKLPPNPVYIQKILNLLSFKKFYLILNLLSNIELNIMEHSFSYQENYNIILYKIIKIIKIILS